MVLGGLLLGTAVAKDIRITIPKFRTKPTPVQKYNQDGVKALKKQKIESAKKLFYKAYLLDPNDPFTLNNLGYIAELEGEVERAQRFYELAGANASEAVVDKSSSKEVEGMPVSQVAGRADAGPLQVNRINVQAIGLLNRDRPFEAEAVLRKAQTLEPNNPFTLNNLGFAMEKQGELEQALRFYEQARATNSDERVVVAVNKDWRGRKIRDVANRNAKKLRQVIEEGQSVEDQVANFNLRGVSSLNRNERKKAREYFEKANKLDPGNAFTLNNMGYVAELDGDRETANFYYEKAKAAQGSTTEVGMATRKEAEGRELGVVADRNNAVVSARMDADLAAKRRIEKPAVLLRRDNSPVVTKPAEKEETPQPPNQ